MRNIDTLLYFMRYFEPHCVERNGETVCYVSALEYPDQEDVIDLLAGNGFIRSDPKILRLKYAGIVRTVGDEHWELSDVELPGLYPVWEAR